MSNKKEVTTKKKETKKVITIKEMITVMKALDSKCDERKTTTADLAVQCLATDNANRIELWKRSETHYDIYVGNNTNVYKCFNDNYKSVLDIDKSISVKTYVDDKKMSKKEIMFKIISKDAFNVVKKVVAEMKAIQKAKTKEVVESEMVAN